MSGGRSASGALLAFVSGVLALASLEVAAFDHAAIRIERRDGVFVAYTVEVARSDAERQQGLMGRQSLATTAGMLFDFGVEQPVAMWMRNTPLALDMLFIAADGVVIDVIEGAVPQTDTLLSPRAPARWVVELGAGQVAARGISTGDRLHLPAALRSSPATNSDRLRTLRETAAPRLDGAPRRGTSP